MQYFKVNRVFKMSFIDKRFFSEVSVFSVAKKAVVLLLILTGVSVAEFDAREEIIKLMEKNGMEKYLTAPVTITQTDSGVYTIRDEGIYAIQHELLKPQMGADPNVVIDKNIRIVDSTDKLVVVTHGWLDKGQQDWPMEMADCIAAKTDPNEWMCAAYDWRGGSAVIASVQAALYSRDIAGPRLAAAILKLDRPFTHIHLVAHSAGAWTINSAARIIAEAKPDTTFHLTFLDAYVPQKWDPDILGRLFDDDDKQKKQVWADHYYTKDITWKVTQSDLKYAHNVDLSPIDPLIKEHEFPYRWYIATITGHYERWDEKNQPVHTRCGEVDYGFIRSLESGTDNWNQSLALPIGNKAEKIKGKD